MLQEKTSKKFTIMSKQLSLAWKEKILRLDDWLRETADKKKICIDPCALHYAGIAYVKKAYKVYQERGYKTKMLSAAYRTPLQWL